MAYPLATDRPYTSIQFYDEGSPEDNLVWIVAGDFNILQQKILPHIDDIHYK